MQSCQYALLSLAVHKYIQKCERHAATTTTRSNNNIALYFDEVIENINNLLTAQLLLLYDEWQKRFTSTNSFWRGIAFALEWQQQQSSSCNLTTMQQRDNFLLLLLFFFFINAFKIQFFLRF